MTNDLSEPAPITNISTAYVIAYPCVESIKERNKNMPIFSFKGNRHKPDLKIRFWCVYIP